MVFPAGVTGIGMGAAFAAIIAGWEQVKNIILRVTGLVIVTVELRGRCNNAVQIYCWQKLRRSPTPFRYYTGVTRFIRPLKRYGPVAYEVIGDSGSIFWHGRKPLWVSMSRSYSDRTLFRFLRWTFNANDLVAEVMRCATELEGPTINEFALKVHGEKIGGVHGVTLHQSSGDPCLRGDITLTPEAYLQFGPIIKASFPGLDPFRKDPTDV